MRSPATRKSQDIMRVKHFIFAIIAALILTLPVYKVRQAFQKREHAVKDLQGQVKNYEQLNTAAQQQLDEKVKALEDTNKNLERKDQEIEQLRKDLQSKKARAAKTAVAKAPTPAVLVSGSCGEWLDKAGVTDKANAMILINKESHCNPAARNPSSGACGVAQELPCGKSGCQIGDGACQVAWMQKYVVQRYGSWAGAVAFHISHGWY